MKKCLFPVLLILFSFALHAQDQYEISTMRIGDYKIFMSAEEADSINGKPIKRPNELSDEAVVFYKGEGLKLTMNEWYDDNGNKKGYQVYILSTYSKKFKTKSGMGVGNTRDDLINAYKNYPNFSVSQGDNESYFNLDDYKANTYLSFRMVNSVVVEITVGLDEGD